MREQHNPISLPSTTHSAPARLCGEFVRVYHHPPRLAPGKSTHLDEVAADREDAMVRGKGSGLDAIEEFRLNDRRI
jgi:hypothetical protein